MKSIKSRYSLSTISSSYYTLSVSGNTSYFNSGTTKGLNQGVIFVPYILSTSESIISDREYYILRLKEQRKEKLNKLGWNE